MNTIKEVLQRAYDNLNHKDGRIYTCLEIEQIGRATGNWELASKALKFFEAQEPRIKRHAEFLNNPYFIKESTAWWSMYQDNNSSGQIRFEGANREDEMKERKRFLKYIIDTL